MRVPFHWAKVNYTRRQESGVQIECTCWGWSDISADDARAHAQERARRAHVGRSSDDGPGRDGYDLYRETPLREPVTDRLYGGDGEQVAAVTRNRYGSLVLNAARVMFVDVDLPAGKTGFWSLFSRRKRKEEQLARHERVVSRIVDWSQAHPEYAFRLYRTAAGYRLLFTDRLFEPLSEEVARIFKALRADALYRLLTRKQQCFRARLTPKYWRLPNMLRYESPHFDRDLYLSQSGKWVERYERDCAGYRVCSLTETFGPAGSTMPPEVAQVVALHDEQTRCGETNLPLA
jgi:hypothetical protein